MFRLVSAQNCSHRADPAYSGALLVFLRVSNLEQTATKSSVYSSTNEF
jgi:hypothetical protein